MVDLDTYFGAGTNGETDDITLRVLPQARYHAIGTGTFTSFSSSAAAFSGSVSVDVLGFKWSGAVDASLTIEDDSNCSMSINGQRLSGTYTAGDYLVISTQVDGYDLTLNIQPWDGGTYLQGKASIVDARLWIGPQGSDVKQHPGA